MERGRHMNDMRVWSLKMAIFASFIHCLPNILHAWPHDSLFTWSACRWPWRYFKVIRLFHIKFLKNGVWYGKSYYRLLIGNYFHFTLTCFVILVERWSGHDAWWGSSWKLNPKNIKSIKFLGSGEVKKTSVGQASGFPETTILRPNISQLPWGHKFGSGAEMATITETIMCLYAANGRRVTLSQDIVLLYKANSTTPITTAVTCSVIMSPLRRHIFVCFMAKSAFWRGFSALAPYTGVGPI